MAMQSLTKSNVSRADATRIIRQHFGIQRTIASYDELTAGYFNASWKITLDDGLACVLKVAPPPGVPVLTYERGILAAEVSVMRLVRAQTAMPVPEIFLHDAGRTIIPSEYFVMTFVPGISLDAARKASPDTDFSAVEHDVGRLLAEMNAIRGKWFGYATPNAPHYNRWPEAFGAMIEGVLKDGETMGVQLPAPYSAIRRLIANARSALDGVQTPRLVHWDLWDGNIFIDPAGGNLTGIIDFERAMWADPLMEINFAGLRDNAAFLSGYGRVMPDSPTERRRRTLYDLYLFLIMVIEHDYRHYSSSGPTEWARRQLSATLGSL